LFVELTVLMAALGAHRSLRIDLFIGKIERDGRERTVALADEVSKSS
jgi:hypothetical protein